MENVNYFECKLEILDDHALKNEKTWDHVKETAESKPRNIVYRENSLTHPISHNKTTL